MPATRSAANPSDGTAHALDPAGVTLRVCVYGEDVPVAGALRILREHLPDTAHLALIGGCAATTQWPDAMRLTDDVDALDPCAVAIAAGKYFPGEHLILIRVGLQLPALACERLLRALDVPDVLGAVPLDHDARCPLPIGSVDTPDASLTDALCFACSDRRVVDDPHLFSDRPAACSAWHGTRLARLGAANLRDRDAIEATGLRIVVLDHLYVGDPVQTAESNKPTSAPTRDPDPPSILDPLRERLAGALESAAMPALAGLDHKPVLLHVLHGWGGGAERWVRDFAHDDAHAHHLVLIARGSFARRQHGEWLELHDGTLTGCALRRWPLPHPVADTSIADHAYRELLAGIVRDYCVDALIVSSLIGHSLDALRSGLPTLTIVHDHYPLWPVLHRDFGDPDLRFDATQRAQDLATSNGGEFANSDPAHWLRLRDATVQAMLAADVTLVAPSRSALANQLRLAPELASRPAHVIGHGLATWPALPARTVTPADTQRLRLMVPGRIRRGKGGHLLRAALMQLRAHADVFLLGAGADAHDFFGESGVHVVLDYQRDDLPTLLARIRPDAALLLPTVAETFSYTLSELRSLGIPVIATRIGALAERIEDGVDGFLVDADAAALTALIDALAADRSPLARVRSALANHSHPTPADMGGDYHALLQLGDRRPARYPLRGDVASVLESAVKTHELQKIRLHNDALHVDLAAARAESAKRGDWGHALDRRLAEVLPLAAELQEVKPHYEQMLASSSWRITAPLRTVNARLRGLRASLSFRSLKLRSLGGRLRSSVAQRGVHGTLIRISQEFRRAGPARARVVFATPREDFEPFTVPCSDDPRISIVVPVFNKIAYTAACLRSVAEHAGSTPFEIIVVDDGSSDATAQRLPDISGIRSLRNDQNLGFVGSCNAGAQVARGDYLLFLNNDTVVTDGWLEAMLDCIESAPDAGMVGAALVYPDGRLQESGGIVFNDGSGWNYGRFDEPDDPRYRFRREVDYCSGAAIMLRRDLFARLGAFDTRYSPAYYEDTDLAFSVRAAGLKVYVEPAATVVHFEGITSGTDTGSGIKRYQVINHEKFLAKWQVALARQPAPGTPIHLAATHRARKRVLIVDATTPMPDQDSGSLRMVNLTRVLVDLGCQVSFLPENRLFDERYTPALQEIGVEALYAPYAQDPVRLMRERGTEFDLVILSRHYVAASFVGLVRLYAPQATLAFDTVDLHYLREQRAAQIANDASLARHVSSTRAQELKLIRESDLTLVVSPVEQALLARDAPGARVEVLSNVHEVFGCRKPFAERHDLVFVGGFQHPPNADAVAWFIGEVFPQVRGELPDLRLHVIGSKVSNAIRALADAQILVHGHVADIAPFMDGCRISVAPLRYGAGVKGKVNMAMSHGLPVVATSAAIEGMHVCNGEDVLVADDPREFATALIQLYRDESLWNTLSANGLANVERHFSFAAARAAVRRIIPGL